MANDPPPQPVADAVTAGSGEWAPGDRLLRLPGIDFATTLSFSRGDANRGMALLRRFVECAERELAACRAALAAGDRVAARAAIHAMRGPAGFAGALRLESRGGALESRLRTAAAVAEVTPMLERLDAEVAALREALVGAGEEAPDGAPCAEAQAGSLDGGPVQADAVIAGIVALLEAGDAHAHSEVARHSALLQHKLGDEARRLRRLVRAFEYDAALCLLAASGASETPGRGHAGGADAVAADATP